MDDDQELQGVINKTIAKIEKGEYTVYITFEDGTSLHVSAGGQGEIWINTEVRD